MTINIYKIISPAYANPIKIVSQSVGQQVRYKTQNFDQSYYNKQFRDWENSSCYSQKWHTDDQTAFQVHATSNASAPVLQLIDKNGKLILDYTSTLQTDTFADNTIVRDSIEFPLKTFTFTISFANVPAGFYFLRLNVGYDTSGGAAPVEQMLYLSEPMYVSSGQNNTILLEYRNTKNQFNTYFNNFAFRLRVEGYIDYLAPDSSDTQYNDEYFDLVLLNSYPYRKFQMLIGDIAGVPAWLFDKINIAVGCPTLKIDSAYYVKGEGAKFNVSQYDRRMYGSLELREASNYYDQTITEKAGIFIMSIPTTKVGVRAIKLDANNYYIAQIVDPSSIGAFMTYLNTTFLTANGLTGIFNRDAVKIFYIPNANETFTTGGSVVLGKVAFVEHSNIKPPGQYLDLNIEMNHAVVDWGDNTAATGTGTGTDVNVHLQHNYSSSVQKTIKIYHDDSFILLSLNEPTTTRVYGDFGNSFKSISLLSGNLGNFDMTDIDKAKNSLLVIILSNCNLTAIAGISWKYPLIQTIKFDGNKMSRDLANAIVTDCDNMARSYTGLQSGTHTLDVHNQIPLAPLWSTGYSAKAHLQSSYLWTVTSD